MASFASLGDVIIAEPKSMIVSPGACDQRKLLIKNCRKDFRPAEFLHGTGLIDMIVIAKKCESRLVVLGYFAVTP